MKPIILHKKLFKPTSFLVAGAILFAMPTLALATELTVTEEADTTVRTNKGSMEYGEGYVERVPASLRLNAPGYDCFAPGCKSTNVKAEGASETPAAEPANPAKSP